MGSTHAEIAASYDVSNDFFRFWLDEQMNYTCALYESESETLEAAQQNKLRLLSDFARVAPGKSVLDIGCGWGACLEYLVRERHVGRAVGITMSPEQRREVIARKLRGVDCVLEDFMKWQTDERFDALLSICMMDHLCSPEEARAGRAVDLYRAFFAKCWALTRPGACFGLQTILRVRVPRDPQDLRDVYFCTHTVFPGGLNPRMEEVIQAASAQWEIVSVHTRREHYRRTTEEWLRRLRLHEERIRSAWGAEVFETYDRYLSTCVRAFDRHYSSIAQYELRRID
jgi:cyclopropane-fatty-acyl-phospholipid synthase